MATILIVDDDQQIRRMLREVLESAGHHVVEAVNGVEGRTFYQSHVIDLVICDLVLPEKSGITLIRELAQEVPVPKLITMSGFTGSLGFTSLDFTKKLGALWTFPKPFELAEMLHRVEDALQANQPRPAPSFSQP